MHSGKRPNVLLIVPDSHRGDSLGCADNPAVSTPNLDAMAREGVVFRRAFTACAACMPSRASILTGRSMRGHGSWINGVPLPKDVPTLAAILRGADYRTAAFGKMHTVPEEAQVRGADPYLDGAYGFEHAALCEDFIRHGPYRRWLEREYPEPHYPFCPPSRFSRTTAPWNLLRCPRALHAGAPLPLGEAEW